MSESAVVVVNLVSGGGRTARRWPRLRDAIAKRGIEAEYHLTEYPWHGYQLARNAIAAGARTVVAVGGDGTLFEVANAIMDAGAGDRVRLGTIPMGTGKDVARCLSIPTPALAMRAIAEGQERLLDAGRVEARDAAGHQQVRHFLLEASAGWVPEISRSVPLRLKRLGDTAPYVLVTLAKMLGPMSRAFTLSIDGQDLSGRYNTISVHNMELWGGEMAAAPGARPDDGLLDAIRWGDLGRLAVVRAIQGQLKGGTHLSIHGIDHHAARSLELACRKTTRLDLDGEDGGYLPAKITVVPRALRFLAPQPV